MQNDTQIMQIKRKKRDKNLSLSLIFRHVLQFPKAKGIPASLPLQPILFADVHPDNSCPILLFALILSYFLDFHGVSKIVTVIFLNFLWQSKASI